jgi:hypothetical protein
MKVILKSLKTKQCHWKQKTRSMFQKGPRNNVLVYPLKSACDASMTTVFNENKNHVCFFQVEMAVGPGGPAGVGRCGGIGRATPRGAGAAAAQLDARATVGRGRAGQSGGRGCAAGREHPQSHAHTLDAEPHRGGATPAQAWTPAARAAAGRQGAAPAQPAAGGAGSRDFGHVQSLMYRLQSR